VKVEAALLASCALFLGACAVLVGIGDLPGLPPDGGSEDSVEHDAPRDVVPADGGADASDAHEASAAETGPLDAPAVFDGGLGRMWFRTRSAAATTTGATLRGRQSVDTSL